MEAMYTWLNSLVNKGKSEFALWSEINWLNPYSAYSYENQRNELLKKIDRSVFFKSTKPFYNHISKGCSICGSGEWSCLFITNKCNANCFYCPTAQNNDELPSTQGLDFRSPNEYATYVKHFDFKGVSFSGGEPLLFFDRTLNYLKAVRSECDQNIYTWMYTNGILAETSKIQTLAAAGLNEIRFDIGATGFSLDKVKLAKDIIPNVTVEIPAIPEEKDRLITLLPELVKAGVTNLNLHQLRLTQYNAAKLIKRGYTILNAERPLVLESELAALEIINAAQGMGLELGINYCSFHFKNRFQKAGYRKMILNKLFPDACITNNGYLREYQNNSIKYSRVKILPDEPGLNHSILMDTVGIKYRYSIDSVLNEPSLSAEHQFLIDDLLLNEPTTAPSDPLLFKIWQYEYIENGLRAY